MKSYEIAPLIIDDYLIYLRNFEEAIHDSKLYYSLNDLSFVENISPENSIKALQKSLKICQLAGIESKHHFKKIFVYDPTDHFLHIDWRMSQKGFNLMIMQFPVLNEKTALWFWELASL
jgi:calcineurin-like phosphoesterase family protein